MITFGVKLAEVPFQVTCLYESTKSFCHDYLTEDAPAFSIEITKQDIEKERVISREQDLRDGVEIQHFSDNYLETIALYRKLAKPLLNYNCLVFHGAGVAVNGKAYLFTARSGTGKTTHAKLWLKKIKNSYVLNGDKPLIKIQKDGIILCGTLWCGKEGFGVNEILPLKAICVLERDTVNHIERITASEALPILYQQSHHCDGVEDMERTLSLLEWLTQNVEFYRMGCNMEDEAALVSYGAMSG